MFQCRQSRAVEHTPGIGLHYCRFLYHHLSLMQPQYEGEKCRKPLLREFCVYLGSSGNLSITVLFRHRSGAVAVHG